MIFTNRLTRFPLRKVSPFFTHGWQDVNNCADLFAGHEWCRKYFRNIGIISVAIFPLVHLAWWTEFPGSIYFIGSWYGLLVALSAACLAGFFWLVFTKLLCFCFRPVRTMTLFLSDFDRLVGLLRELGYFETRPLVPGKTPKLHDAHLFLDDEVVRLEKNGSDMCDRAYDIASAFLRYPPSQKETIIHLASDPAWTGARSRRNIALQR